MKLTDEKRAQLYKIIDSANPIMIFAIIPSLDENFKEQLFAGGEGSDESLTEMFAEVMNKDARIARLFHAAVIKHTEDRNPGATQAVEGLIKNVILFENRTGDKKDLN